MYTKRVQIINYGPIAELDIELPFVDETPNPVVLVGENGSGKSIFLSHIANGLLVAKDHAFSETPEIEAGKVFKIRSNSYIKSGTECYFARADFEDGFFFAEMRSRHLKREYEVTPPALPEGDAKAAWDKMAAEMDEYMDSNILTDNSNTIRELSSKNCALYFPSNRFEEPAWLNQENLVSQAEYMDLTTLRGHTSRKVINYSPLHDNRNWLFNVVYDRSVLSEQTATQAYAAALKIVRLVMNGYAGTRFGIGPRRNRVVTLESDAGQLVPNIFQLSSGETSLLNLFLSILRDFDLYVTPFVEANEVRGIVLVDEIDLHLHTVHQYDILPSLMRMFPKVQFIVTTHSPLFVLGMAQIFEENGFALYRMPQGQEISPEEFNEFGETYQAFAATSKFSDDIRSAVRDSQSPILYMEGKTDVQYLKTAGELLGKQSVLNAIELNEKGGGPNLKKIWDAVKNLPVSMVPRKVVLLHDCDNKDPDQTKENRFRRTVPTQSGHPIEKGIENLFSRQTIESALSHKEEFIDVSGSYPDKKRGKVQMIPEKWRVNEDEKTNLCDWLCENGTADDFEHFQVIFDLLEEVLSSPKNEPCNSA